MLLACATVDDGGLFGILAGGSMGALEEGKLGQREGRSHRADAGTADSYLIRADWQNSKERRPKERFEARQFSYRMPAISGGREPSEASTSISLQLS